MNPKYTAKELIEILEKAKQLGVTNLTVEGLTASWAVREAFQQPGKSGPVSVFNKDACGTCGSEFTEGQWGPYCHPCHLKRKEERFQREKRW